MYWTIKYYVDLYISISFKVPTAHFLMPVLENTSSLGILLYFLRLQWTNILEMNEAMQKKKKDK